MPDDATGWPRAGMLASGALVWGITMAVSLAVSLEISIGGLTSHRTALTLLYFVGGLVAFPPAVLIARALSGKKAVEVRFAAAFFCLCAATISITAGLFAALYWTFFAHWSEAFLSIAWIQQTTVTIIAALYQFAAVGLRFFFPVGFVALFVVSILLAKRMR
ncbi:hypothetical protein [Hoeflea prorocentri]|uniref:Uncharacterized protein n=1 Tax=Hoeflea prorocentri TaxID=1922333 RepID=A0A9X3UFG4_9HYPH|nr:hypothetical protein [Hoeflea prorocentri]MCY6380373.1 hypothetical protein [Hoeflea prorocentri]MDA5398173.1 hypothetical protein [Hoeflea prorocentri]